MDKVNTSLRRALILFAAAAVLTAAVLYSVFPQAVSPQLLPLAAVLVLIIIGFLYYELTRPSAQESAAVAVLCAAAVAGRVLFAPLPNFKPVGAVVIIAGAVFGAPAGFITGAVSALCSNLLFGQGAWTPWQMLGFALAGALSGVLNRRGWLLKRTRLCLFGVAMGYLYGIIVDGFYLIGYVEPSPQAVFAALMGGLLFNTIHAAANGFFLFCFGEAWAKKLVRIRDKG
ncbi:ECF transporter S component [Acetanaerobacterium elongatum]|uniref:Energy-coupling factor transport system substrate-specific component n=1 Tax=Acetanaerobacterium elongatum TaxID=258515 RepID=A0A1G9XXL1_9FIRM|nr:ECF transporter S component [Acetanaerobacterium elongatum]SDN01572.1 energy-coupling factor transport system substrate-specific component [Acetanaerobacterium elongatum]